MNSRILIITLCSFCFHVLAETENRPSSEQVREQVRLMGDDAYRIREKAQETLSSWSDTYPRYLLTQLATAYQGVEDVEVETRLRELLEPLAMTYLFSRPDGYLGVHLGSENLGNEVLAIVFQRILPGEAAERSGLQDGDLILLMNGIPMKEIGGQQGFSRAIAETLPGSAIELGVKRGDREFLTRVVIGMRPETSSRFRSNQNQDRRKEFITWLGALKPSRTLNGMPVGHYPLEETDSEELKP